MLHTLAASAAGVPIRAVASRDPARAESLATRVGARAASFADLPAGADAVVVCTPPDRHLEDALRALQAGAVVMVEKPLVSTLGQADALVDAGGTVLYAENLAFSPLFTQTSELAGGIGTLSFIEIRLLSPRPTWGDFLTPARGGGVLFDLGSHAIALALLLAGSDDPVSVSASLTSSAGVTVDDWAEVILDFASGLRARIETCWTNPDVVWDVQVSSETGVVRTEVLPEPGIEHNGEPVALHARPSGPAPQIEMLGYTAQMRVLHDLVGGVPSPIDARFGRRVLEVICAAYTSAGRNHAVTLPFEGPRDSTPHELWSDTVGR